MTKDTILEELLLLMNDIPENPDIYMLGVLLNDTEVLGHLEVLTLMQSMVMQSVQANNHKRAMKYIVAFRRLLKTNTAVTNQLKTSITAFVLS